MKKKKSPHPAVRATSTEETKGNNIIVISKYPARFITSLAIIIAIVGILCYIQTLSFKYTLDDFSIIKENRVTTEGVGAIGTIFTTPFRYGNTTQGDPLYRPIPKSIFAILWSIFPDHPFPYHLLNVFLFGTTGFLLMITVIKYLGNQIYLAFIACLLFMVHPIHTEVVSNVKSLDEILSLFFFVLSLFWIHHYLVTYHWKWLMAATISYLISLMSKESAITFVALFPLTIYFFTKAKPSLNLRITLWMLIPAALFLLIRTLIFKGYTASLPPAADNMLTLPGTDFLTQKATALALMGKYLMLLIFPHPLVFDYSVHQLSLVHASDWRFLLSLLIYGALVAYALITFKKKNLAAFGILFFLITASLSSNLFRLIGTHFAERLMYTPSFGFCFVVAFVLATYLDRKEETKQKFITIPLFFQTRPILMSATAVVTIAFTLKTITQVPVWHDNLSLFEHGVRSTPNSMRTHYYLGNYLIEGDYYNSLPAPQQAKERNRGIAELKKSIIIYPYQESYFSLGIAHYLVHDYDSSLYYYNEAIKLAPYMATYHNNIATVFFETKQLDKALAECQLAVQLDPNYAEAFCNLGSIYGSMNKLDEAMINFEKALAIDPNHARANYYMGKVLQNSAIPEDQSRAKFYLDKAKSLDPKYNN